MTPSRLAGFVLAVLAAAWAPRALAWPGYFANDCSGCHDSAVKTCHGCHSHGAQQSSAKTAISITGSLDKATYAPGEPVTVTVTGGYEPGMFEAAWQRIVLFDEGMNEVRRGTNDYPVTLSAPAPAAPGSYSWAIAWYGNAARDMDAVDVVTSETLRPGYFTLDADQPDHGWQTVALPSFTVSAAGGARPTPAHLTLVHLTPAAEAPARRTRGRPTEGRTVARARAPPRAAAVAAAAAAWPRSCSSRSSPRGCCGGAWTCDVAVDRAPSKPMTAYIAQSP